MTFCDESNPHSTQKTFWVARNGQTPGPTVCGNFFCAQEKASHHPTAGLLCHYQFAVALGPILLCIFPPGYLGPFFMERIINPAVVNLKLPSSVTIHQTPPNLSLWLCPLCLPAKPPLPICLINGHPSLAFWKFDDLAGGFSIWSTGKAMDPQRSDWFPNPSFWTAKMVREFHWPHRNKPDGWSRGSLFGGWGFTARHLVYLSLPLTFPLSCVCVFCWTWPPDSLHLSTCSCWTGTPASHQLIKQLQYLTPAQTPRLYQIVQSPL